MHFIKLVEAIQIINTITLGYQAEEQACPGYDDTYVLFFIIFDIR